MQLRSGLVLFLSLVAAERSAAFGQAQDRRFLEEERRAQLDEGRLADPELEQPFLWEAGAWLQAQFIQLDDPPQRDTRTVRYLDFRLWGEAVIEQHYTVFLRLQTDYADFNSGDQFEGSDDNQYSSPHIDQAWVEADYSTMARDLSFRAGRQFVSLGRGLLFNQVAYAVMGSYAEGPFGLRAFVAHTPPHDDDIDLSRPNNDDSYRGFAGLEFEYFLSGSHRAYAMALVERDFNDEEPEIPAQDFDYNANYVGLGFRGELFAGLGYSAEAVYQFGESVAAGTTTEEDITAYSFMIGLDFQPGGATDPYFIAEYLYGSGDPDRGSVTDTASGNLAGTDDEGFLAFGFVQTGFSLFPRLSNIHIVRVGASFWPLQATDTFRYLEVGVYGYLYRKDESAAPISDPDSFLNDSDVGEEIDLLLRWRIVSDVGMTVSYGIFMPGGAYMSDKARDFIAAGVTYSF